MYALCLQPICGTLFRKRFPWCHEHLLFHYNMCCKCLFCWTLRSHRGSNHASTCVRFLNTVFFLGGGVGGGVQRDGVEQLTWSQVLFCMGGSTVWSVHLPSQTFKNVVPYACPNLGVELCVCVSLSLTLSLSQHTAWNISCICSKKLPEDGQQLRPQHVRALFNKLKYWSTSLCWIDICKMGAWKM